MSLKIPLEELRVINPTKNLLGNIELVNAM